MQGGRKAQVLGCTQFVASLALQLPLSQISDING